MNKAQKNKKKGNVGISKNARGITLIALIVTIIVLIILAGVTLNLLMGDNGILVRAKASKIIQNKTQAQEYLKLEIMNVQMAKAGNATLANLMEEFGNDARDDIDILSIETEVATLSCEIPIEPPTEITVMIMEYNEFTFSIGDSLEVTKVCGIDIDEWNGETVNTPVVEKTKITITATPSSQTESNVEKQEVQLLINSSKGWENWEGKYAWNTSSSQKPTGEEWKNLSLDDGSNNNEKTVKAETTENQMGNYYLWVKITTKGRTVTQSFGPYKLEANPTISDIVCVFKADSKSDNDTKGKVEVGSTKTFEGWKLAYTINEGNEIEIEQGTTRQVDVVKNDYIEVIYSKTGKTDVISPLRITELKTGYTLNYDATEGVGAPESLTQYSEGDNSTFTISSTTPTRTGYNFVGWTTNSDRTGTVYNAGGSITVTGTTTLYAKWEESITASVIFNNSNELTEGTVATITGTASSGIASATLKIGNYTVYSETISGTQTNYNKAVNIDDMMLESLQSLTFNETNAATLTITSKAGVTKNSSSVNVVNYTIGNSTQLKALASAVNNSTNPSTFTGKTIYQTADITVSNYLPIGYVTNSSNLEGYNFAGIYNGNNHWITISSWAETGWDGWEKGLGVFGYTNDATIKNLESNGTISESDCAGVGGIVGCMYGGNITNCTNSGEVTGGYSVGGICGQMFNGGTIIYCKNKNSINSSGDIVGGICGRLSDSSNIEKCFNDSSVSGANYAGGVGGFACDDVNIIDCYNSGSVSCTNNDAGGLVGLVRADSINSNLTITGSYNIGRVTGKNNVGGLLGQHTRMNNKTCSVIINYSVWSDKDKSGNALPTVVCGSTYDSSKITTSSYYEQESLSDFSTKDPWNGQGDQYYWLNEENETGAWAQDFTDEDEDGVYINDKYPYLKDNQP